MMSVSSRPANSTSPMRNRGPKSSCPACSMAQRPERLVRIMVASISKRMSMRRRAIDHRGHRERRRKRSDSMRDAEGLLAAELVHLGAVDCADVAGHDGLQFG